MGTWLVSEEVKEMFLNCNITYNVSDCRLVEAPILINWHRGMYVWDFERKTLVVMDPISMQRGEHYMADKHKTSVEIMHDAVKQCKDTYFPDSQSGMKDWSVEYLIVPGAEGDSNNSGIYSLFYARYFDGKYLTRILTKEALQLQKCNIQLLTMFGNTT